MKKLYISFLIMTLTLANISLVNISSVQAATTDNTSVATTTTDNNIKVSLDNIRDTMIANNLNIKTLDNNLKITEQKYQDAKDAETTAISTETTKNADVVTANTNVTTANANVTNANKTGDQTAIDKANSDLDAAKTEAKIAQELATTAEQAVTTATKGRDTARENLKTEKIKYDQGVEAKVYAAQQDYITYLSDLSNEKLNGDKVTSNQEEQQVYKLQYESGFISKNEYTSKMQETTSVDDLNKSKDTEELDRTKLCNALGITPEENVTFNTDITEEFQVISKINYDDDLKQMLDNNVNIKLANDDITTLNDEIDAETDTTNSTDTINNYNKDNTEIALKQQISTAETNFKEQYNTLTSSYNSIKSGYDSLSEKQQEYNIMQTKYNYGFASKKDVSDEKLALDTQTSKFASDKNKLYVDYLRYIQMKEGY
ncbi:hypothetical protein [Clostridium uliginosum]|uniref:Outer membrane efflux protein n=1 Tax=Clostridium uliginosum TaxID=119641 RepID=A0A1I1N8H3_9CLOT|nr:hypothetical protein [Clostridium uliginosum]SFC91768.1 hypothetical protein SAMN05421842_11361 [Clostridium uliginosum]